MQGKGYDLKEINVKNLVPIKDQYNVPQVLRSCHTAIVDGYIIEGHVPVDAIERLLTERPDVLGIGTPGMPAGSPGMEMLDGSVDPYDVYTFDAAGNIEVFASYP